MPLFGTVETESKMTMIAFDHLRALRRVAVHLHDGIAIASGTPFGQPIGLHIGVDEVALVALTKVFVVRNDFEDLIVVNNLSAT